MGNVSNSDADFSATRWSLIVAAANANEPSARPALEELFRKYWYPVYAFLRRQGRTPPDAQDLTQSFFADLFSRNWLRAVSAEKGKFRTFLLACLRHHLSHVRAHENGPTRHPGVPILSLDAGLAEESYALEPVDVHDPARLFERRWVYRLIDDCLHQLKEEYAAEGRATVFDTLREHLVGDAERGAYDQSSARLNMTAGAVRVAVTRMRDRFRERLRAEVARTVEDPRNVDEEIRYLITLSQQ